MRYYVNPYPNPRAYDGETSGYWQRRSQVFGKTILNPNPEKVDLDGDGIVEALQQSKRAISPAKPIASESGLVSFEGMKPERKITLDKAGIGADGKITLDLTANDIDRLVQDLSHLGGENIATFGRNASVTIDASKLAELETLDSLAFGRTPQREVPKEGEGTKPAKSKKGKTWEEIEAEGRAIVESYTKGIIVNPGNTWGGAYMLPGGDSARDLVPGTPPKITAEEWLKQGKKGSEGSKDNRGTKNKSQTKVGNSASQNTRETNKEGLVSLSAPKEASQDNKGADLSVTRVKRPPRGESDLFTVRQAGASGFSSGGTPGMVVTRGERSISYDGMNFTSWKEGTPQPMPTESKPSTTIIIKSASFESQARQPAGLTRNAFGQPIPRPRFPSISHTVGGSSSGGSSNSQVRTGSSSSRGTSGGGARVQVAPRASSSRGTSGGGVRVQWSRG